MDALLPIDLHALDIARRRLWNGESLPTGLLPAPIARSWERSRDAGLSPWAGRLSGGEAREVVLDESDLQLQESVRPELERLWQVFGGQSWTLFCVNTQGVIVDAQHAKEPGRLDSLHIGRCIDEADIGTTAPGCTLLDGKPIVLRGGHHYLTEFGNFFCVSVPIHGVNGNLIGALDITGLGERNATAVMEQLCIAAMGAENRLYGGLKDCQVISLQHDPRLIGTPFQGLLAIDQFGRVVAANSTACKLLNLQKNMMSDVTDWRHLFEVDPIASASRQVPSLIRLNDGSSVYAHTIIQAPSRSIRSVKGAIAQSPLGRDASLNLQFEAARKAFKAGIPVLLRGETGTGKEVFARALHDACTPDAPFVAINCSAIPESLIEAELFGYTDGTFTGAKKGGAAGRLEEADGGTLLLDEIGDMPTSLQTRLLRVLQERQITRLGSSLPKPLNVRVVSATHCDLELMISERRFREDLYYRLAGFQVALPALRERQDIDFIIQTLLSRYAVKEIDEQCLEQLKACEWRGNVRELEQVIRLAAALSGDDGSILPEHLIGLPTAVPEEASPLLAAEQRTIDQVLRAHKGNISATASALGISRTTLYKKIKSF
ncbi:transcriptional regulator of acetoin/glycerol metabolism [Pseudomonas sp. F-14 TE3623]